MVNKKSFGVSNQKTLPEMELMVDLGNGDYVKKQKCFPNGNPTYYSGATSFRVSLSDTELAIKLPDHRVFVIMGPNGPKIITGIVNLPLVSSLESLYTMRLAPGSIIELDSKYIKKEDYYRFPGDINHKIVRPDNTYLFVGQLALWRGTEVTSIGYIEVYPESRHDVRSWSNIYKTSDLPPLIAALEQAHLQILQGYPEKLEYAGQRVLEYASSINYRNRYLVFNRKK